MNRILATAAALLFATAASAQLYKQVDKDGKVTYTDQPPAGTDSKPLNIPSTATGTSSDAPKSALAKDKELEKGRKAEREAGKKGEEEAKRKADNAERCENAKNNLRISETARRPSRLNAKGEQEYLDEKEIEADKAARRADVERACKTS
jgi:hypothetical protein